MTNDLSFSVSNTVFSKNILPLLAPNVTKRTNRSVQILSNLAAEAGKQRRKSQMIGVDIQQVSIIVIL